ncbi:MAG: hypothetical protein ACQCXQ_11250 [Verrucomicrobiales bacterium]|nr:hypothetical protein [Verrucomicrobiota bacterium JB025]
MADESKPKSGGGCLTKLVTTIVFAAALGLGVALVFAVLPQEYPDAGGGEVSKRDLKLVLKNSVERGYAVTIEEQEVNQWLARVLEAKQGGVLGGQVELKRVWVRLGDGVGEVVMEREAFGRRFTVSMFLAVEQTEEDGKVRTQVHLHGGQFTDAVQRPMRGGRFGRLVVPQGFLILVLPAFQELADQFDEEIRYGFEEMSRISIEEGKLVLDPRNPAMEMKGLLPGTTY